MVALLEVEALHGLERVTEPEALRVDDRCENSAFLFAVRLVIWVEVGRGRLVARDGSPENDVPRRLDGSILFLAEVGEHDLVEELEREGFACAAAGVTGVVEVNDLVHRRELAHLCQDKENFGVEIDDGTDVVGHALVFAFHGFIEII